MLDTVLLVVALLAASHRTGVLYAAGRRHTGHPSITIPGRPKPKEETYHGCPPWGHGGDPLESLLKNRIDRATHPRTFTVSQFLHLSWPGEISKKGLPMARWSAADRKQVYRYLGMSAALEGYAVSFDHTGPGEPTNCMGKGGFDFHMWVAANPHQGRKQSVITEMTPRVRVREDGFDVKKLARIAERNQKVRLVGWIFFDNDHPLRETDRATLWEIHPVTEVDVWRTSRWVKVAG
jgi:hypothetical protein